MLEQIVIPSAKTNIVLEDFGVTIEEDIMDLSIALAGEKDKLGENAGITKFATCIADFLNTRWKEQLGSNVLNPGNAMKILGPVMDRANTLKKNISDSAK